VLPMSRRIVWKACGTEAGTIINVVTLIISSTRPAPHNAGFFHGTSGSGLVALSELSVFGGVRDGSGLNPAHEFVKRVKAPATPEIFRAAANAPHFGKR
jgi:hypothetical protein